MGYSTGKDLHVNVPLSNVVMAYNPTGMIADQIAPMVPVSKQSDAYTIYSVAEALTIENYERAPKTEAVKIYRSLSSGTYFCKGYAAKDDISYEDLRNKDAGFVFLSEANRANYLKNKLYLGREYRAALTITSTSNVGSSSAVGSNWSELRNGYSDPVADVETAIDNVRGMSGGYEANSLLFSRIAWKYFKSHAGVHYRFYGDGTGASGRVITTDMVKSLFGVERVLVGSALRNTTQEGQTAANTEVWGTCVLAYYAPPTPSVEVPSFMYTFEWTEMLPWQVEIHRDEKKKAEEVEVGHYDDLKITGSTLGFLITDVRSAV
jgi:hypothetical protein